MYYYDYYCIAMCAIVVILNEQKKSDLLFLFL